MKLRPWFASANLLVATYAATAAGLETNGPPAPAVSPDSVFEVMLRMVGALLVVFAVFLAAVWFFKRSRFFTIYQGTTPQLRILETKALGYRNSLIVVGYHHRRFLLAVSPSAVSVVSVLPDGVLKAGESESSMPAPEEIDSGEFAKRLSTLEAGKG